MTTLNAMTVYPRFTADDAKRVKGRHDLAKEGNVSSSLVDAVFQDFRDGTVNGPEAEQLRNWNFRLERTLPLIEQHVDKRVSHFFAQAVVCHQTPYRFSEGHTVHQGYKGKTLIYPGTENIPIAGAHSPTVPCLIAEDPNTGIKSVYLYRSHVYDEGNATIDMIKPVNEADSALDHQAIESLLRDKAIALHNNTATGPLTPVQTAKAFVAALIEEIDTAIERETNARVRFKRPTRPDVLNVLQIYRENALAIAAYFERPESFDVMLNLDMKDPAHKKIAKTVTQLKSGQATDRAEVLALIKKKIGELPLIIRQQLHEQHNIAQTPNHFYALYQVWILSCFPEADVGIIEEAMGISRQDLFAQAAQFKNIGTTRALLSEHADKIQAIALEIIPLTSHLQGRNADLSALQGLSPEKQASLRPAIFELQYKMIQASQKAESIIVSKIENALHIIKQRSRADDMETFFYQEILNSALLPDTKKSLGKLLNISPLTIGQKIRELKYDKESRKIFDSEEKKEVIIDEKVKRVTNVELLNYLSSRIAIVAAEPTAENKEWIKNLIISVHDLMNQGRKNPRFTPLFYKRLFEQAETAATKELIRETINYSEETIDETIRIYSTTPTAETFLANNAALIREINIVALAQMKILKKETTEFQRKLFVELRKAQGMNEKEFQAIYKNKFPGYPMSNGTVYNLKKGIKKIDAVIINQVCDIFAQNKSLFYPSNFSDDEV